MAYTPSLNDIPENGAIGFQPSVEDIPKPPVELPTYQYRPPGLFLPSNPAAEQARQQQAQQAAQGFTGFLKSYGNIPTEIMNYFRQPQPVPFPLTNKAQQVGGLAGDLSSFFLPGEMIKGAVKGATYLPKIGTGANALLKTIQESPFLKNLLNVGRTGLETATMEARKNPAQTPLETTLEGVKGAGLQTLMNMALSTHPIVNTIAKLAIGAGGGYLGGKLAGVPSYESVPTGLATTFGLPKALKELGVTGGPVSEEFLSHINPLSENYADMTKRLTANKLLGTAIRPSEASNNVFLGRLEGNIPSTSAGAQEMAAQEAIRTKDQQRAINNLLDTIHADTPEAKTAIRSAYKNANQWNMKPEFMDAINDDPIVQAAMKDVDKQPAYQKGLRGIPKNNVMYLDRVKRAMDDMESAAINVGNKEQAKIIGDTRREFYNAIDNSVPEYARARGLAERSIVRSNISKLLRQGQNKEINGYNFFRKVIANDEQYQKLYQSLRNAPDAQKQLQAMKQGWDTLIPSITPRAAVKLTETSMNKGRAGVQQLITMFKDLIGAKRDVERAKFIFSKDWENEFGNIQKLQDQKERRNAMIKLIGKSLGAEGGKAYQEMEESD